MPKNLMLSKKDLLFVGLLFIVSLFLLHSLLKSGIYYSHDSQVHIARLAQFGQAIGQGQLPVRWLANWNSGYGYPTFVYAYSFPYYLGTLIKVFGLTYEQIFKILMYLSLFLSSLTFYYFARKFASPFAAFIGSVFYVSAPYRFADIYERGALGEALFFVFAPLLFLGPILFAKNTFKGFLVTSISTFALITTHALSFAILLPMAIFYSAIYLKMKSSLIIRFLLSIAFGFALAAYQWIPMIFEQKYIELDKTYFNIYEGNFISIYQLLRIPKDGINIGTGIQFGTAQTVIILFALYYLAKRLLERKPQNLLLFFLVISTIISAFLTTDLSKELWINFKPLQTLIFSWRFLTYTTFATAIMATIIMSQVKLSKFKIILACALIILAIFQSRHYLEGKNWHTHSKEFYTSYTDPLKLDSYYLPKDTNEDLENLSLPQLSIIQGRGNVNPTIINSNEIQAEANLLTNSLIQFHTIYFPGWHLYVDNQKTDITSNKRGLEGIIVASIEPGLHKLDLRFEETPLRKTANYITVISLLLLLSVLILKRKSHAV